MQLYFGTTASSLEYVTAGKLRALAVTIERRLDALPDIPALAADLVRLNVDVIVTRGTPSALAAWNATKTIPIVMASIGNAIGTGLAANLARPGGNVTGLTAINNDTEAKRLELLKEAVPGVVRMAAIYNMGNPTFALRWKQVELAARALDIECQLLDVRKPEDIGRAFTTATDQKVGALRAVIRRAAKRLNSRTGVGLLLRPLPHELQCHPGRRAGIRELHFVGGNGSDDTALIGGSNEIWKGARLDVGVDGLGVLVHRIRPGIGDRS